MVHSGGELGIKKAASLDNPHCHPFLDSPSWTIKTPSLDSHSTWTAFSALYTSTVKKPSIPR